MQQLLRHLSTRVILDRYTQAVTPAKRAAQTERLNCHRCAVLPQGEDCQGCLSWSSEVCWKFVPFCAYEFSVQRCKLLILNWRPRRDLNPCYRREGGMAKRNSNKQQEHERTGWRSRNSKKHLIVSPMCPPLNRGLRPSSPCRRSIHQVPPDPSVRP